MDEGRYNNPPKYMHGESTFTHQNLGPILKADHASLTHGHPGGSELLVSQLEQEIRESFPDVLSIQSIHSPVPSRRPATRRRRVSVLVKTTDGTVVHQANVIVSPEIASLIGAALVIVVGSALKSAGETLGKEIADEVIKAIRRDLYAAKKRRQAARLRRLQPKPGRARELVPARRAVDEGIAERDTS
mgnify:FL=1